MACCCSWLWKHKSQDHARSETRSRTLAKHPGHALWISIRRLGVANTTRARGGFSCVPSLSIRGASSPCRARVTCRSSTPGRNPQNLPFSGAPVPRPVAATFGGFRPKSFPSVSQVCRRMFVFFWFGAQRFTKGGRFSASPFKAKTRFGTRRSLSTWPWGRCARHGAPCASSVAQRAVSRPGPHPFFATRDAAHIFRPSGPTEVWRLLKLYQDWCHSIGVHSPCLGFPVMP